MRCCRPKEEKTGPKPLSDRRCTDILILILFALFWGGLVAIFTVVWSTGDTMSLFYRSQLSAPLTSLSVAHRTGTPCARTGRCRAWQQGRPT